MANAVLPLAVDLWLCLCPAREDDESRSQLRSRLAEVRPVELVLPKQDLSEATRRVLKAALRAPRVNRLPCAESAERVVEDLAAGAYFGGEVQQAERDSEGDAPRSGWPPLVKVRPRRLHAW